MALTTDTGAAVVRSLIPARLDRLPWTRFHTRLIMALGTAWILDGLEITLAGVVDGVLVLESSTGITGKILRIDGTRMGRPRAVKPLVRLSGRLAQAAPARRAARGGSLCRAW